MEVKVPFGEGIDQIGSRLPDQFGINAVLSDVDCVVCGLKEGQAIWKYYGSLLCKTRRS